MESLFTTRASMTLTRSVSEGERFTGLFDESRQPSVRPRSRFGLVCAFPNVSSSPARRISEIRENKPRPGHSTMSGRLCVRESESFRGLMARAGLPATTVQAGISRVTTDWAPTTAPSPTTTPGATKARAQTQACGEMTIGAVTSRMCGSEISCEAVQSIASCDTVA